MPAKPGTEPNKLMLLDIERSGLSPKDAKLMHLAPLDASAMKALHPKHERLGYKIPYFNLDGSIREGFWRVRFTARPEHGFEAITEPVKPLRYVQPANSGCYPYFPPLALNKASDIWADIAKDIDFDLVITEGEKKAACCVKNGQLAIGLGGVSNFRTHDQEHDKLLPVLEEFIWEGRLVTILYDSDAHSNFDVRNAMVRLASILTSKGAIVSHVEPPAGDSGTKQGVDDWLLPLNGSASSSLEALVKSAKQFELNKAFMTINASIVQVLRQNIYYDPKNDVGMNADTFTYGSDFGGLTYTKETKTDSGDTKTKLVRAVPEWRTWPYRRYVRDFTYVPCRYGEEQQIVDGCWNTWKGWGCEPAKGDVAPFYDLIKTQLLPDASAEAEEWWLKRHAWIIQHPAEHSNTAMLLWSATEGTGKSTWLDTIALIVGMHNTTKLSSRDFEKNNNYYLHDSIWVMAEELNLGDRRNIMDKMKDLISAEHHTVEMKYAHPYMIKAVTNFCLASNHGDAIVVARTDRRMFIQQVAEEKFDKAKARAYHAWLKYGGGKEAIFHHLLEYPLGDFDNNAPPPMTAAKANAISDSLSSVHSWLLKFVEQPPCIFMSAKQLQQAYQAEHPDQKPIDVMWFSRQLRNAGLKQACKSFNVVIDGKTTRVWSLTLDSKLKDHYWNMRLKEVQAVVDQNPDVVARKKFEQRKKEVVQ